MFHVLGLPQIMPPWFTAPRRRAPCFHMLNYGTRIGPAWATVTSCWGDSCTVAPGWQYNCHPNAEIVIGMKLSRVFPQQKLLALFVHLLLDVLFERSMLKVAPFCAGGNSMKVSATLATSCCT